MFSLFQLCVWTLCVQFIICYDVGSREGWKGRWFPSEPDQKDTNPVVKVIDEVSMMTVVDPACDDGKTNLTLDWDGSVWAHTCYMPRSLYRPNPNINPVLKCEHIPATYSAIHVCMNTTVSYDWTIPTYGAHRSVWARYGEYRYLPRQRWLHNLEHGAVVMLYHPCANHNEVLRLKHLVQGCLFRHVITPDRLVSEIRPLVLLTWGCRYEMSYVHAPSVRDFITKHALRGSEQISKDGLYDEALLKPASIVSDEHDSTLCSTVAHM